MHLPIKTSTILLTGGAGFIGSNILLSLNKMGYSNIIIVDDLTEDKKKNIKSLKYKKFYNKSTFLKLLDTGKINSITTIIHMGACSDTREYNKEYLRKNNYEYSQKLFRYAVKHNCQFIYASSASVYGNGAKGYQESLIQLRPLNPYGKYKYLFDKWVLKQKIKPLQWVGFRFFNVYGPHEKHKGPMASVVYHGFNQVKKTGYIQLFKSHKRAYTDGMQLRDFVYVKDVVNVVLFFLRHKEKSGIYNVGTGKARAFLDLGKAIFKAVDKKINVQFIPMPDSLRTKYQYYTQADISKLRAAGYKKSFTTLEKGVEDYVKNFLRRQSL